jgi:hypothetical protein
VPGSRDGAAGLLNASDGRKGAGDLRPEVSGRPAAAAAVMEPAGCTRKRLLLYLLVALGQLLSRPGGGGGACAYPTGAGSCHTASDGHGAAGAGSGGYRLQLLAPAASAPGSVATLRLSQGTATAPIKGFLIKLTGPGGDYDAGGAAFEGLAAHALAQPKACYGPAAATHRSAAPKTAVELAVRTGPRPANLTVTVVVVAARTYQRLPTWCRRPSSTSTQCAPIPLPPPPLLYRYCLSTVVGWLGG